MREFFQAVCKSRRIRLILVWCGLILLICSGADYYFETRGIPDFCYEKIRKICRRNGYDFTASAIRCGFFYGLQIENMNLSGGSYAPSLYAENVSVRWTPFEIFQGVLLPFKLRVSSGRLDIPIFPEYGEEAASDVISISNLNAGIGGEPGLLKIYWADGVFNGIYFRMRGTIDNLLHFSGMKGMEFLKTSLSENHGERELSNRMQTKQSPGEAGKNTIGKDFILMVPMDFRIKLLSGLEKISSKKFNGKAVCDLEFKWDMTDFKRCQAKAELFFPAFSYGNLPIQSITEIFSLKDGCYSIDKLLLRLPDRAFIDASAQCDSEGKTAVGQFTGTCRIQDILLFFNESARNVLSQKLGLRDERVSFQGNLKDFSPATGHFAGSLNLKLPTLTIDGVRLKNAELSIDADDQKIKGRLLKADLAGGGTLSGTFEFAGTAFRAELEGNALKDDIRKILPANIDELIRTNVVFTSPEESVAFKGKLQTDHWEKTVFSGSFDVMIPGVTLKQLKIKRLTATLEFSPESIRIIGMDAKLADNTSLSGDFFCNPEEQTFSAKLVCTGNPDKILSSLGDDYRRFLNGLTGDIVWPSSEHSVEGVMNIHVNYGDKPFHYMTGSLILRDFSYRDIKFRYGAARFIITADNTVLLPDVVLETASGRMSLSAAYEPSKKNILKDGLAGILNFSMSSTLTGNDIIRCLYPEWQSKYVDFPYPVKVEAAGLIDYENEDRTRFNAHIQNGACQWKSMKIHDIDAVLKYANQTISFHKAEAVFCGGRVDINYDYCFDSDTGNIAVVLWNADMERFIQTTHLKDFPDAGKKSFFSGSMKSSFCYDEKDDLRMNGDGTFEVSGNNLWSVPLLGKFLRIIGGVWSLDDFGSVTRVSGEFNLKEETLHLKKIKSNGGILSLDANGTYQWNSNDFDITFRALLLKNTLPFNAMSRLLQPVSWMLEKRFRGNANSYQWMDGDDKKNGS